MTPGREDLPAVRAARIAAWEAVADDVYKPRPCAGHIPPCEVGREELAVNDAGILRMPMLERSEVGPEIGALCDQLLAQRGVVPCMFRTIARAPELALGIAGFLKPLMGDGALPGWYKELIATRVAFLQNCDY